MDTLVLLAGGEARRLPRKLERKVRGEPLVVDAFRRFRNHFSVAISLAAPFPEDILHELKCRLIFDRYDKRGPLGGMITACETLTCKTLGFVAADLPFVDAPLVKRLRRAWQDGDEATVASHGDRIDPLVGWYDRRALLREGREVLESENAAVYRLIGRLRLRFVPVLPASLVNINTPEDLQTLRAELL